MTLWSEILVLLAAVAGAATFSVVLFHPFRTGPVDQALRGRR